MEDKILKRKFNAIYFIVYATWACYSPFLIVYFKDRNLDFVQMGIIFSVLPLVGVICQPLWGYITDKYLNKKATLIIIMGCSASIILLFIFAKSFYTIMACTILLSMFITSIFPVLDAYFCDILTDHSSIQFGKVRLMGSVGYAIWVVLIGILIENTNIYAPYFIYTFLCIVCIAIISTIKYKGCSSGQRIKLGDVAGLFKNSSFLIFILSIIVINISTGANMNYMGELIKQTGGSVAVIGFLWSVLAISEAPVFFIGGRIIERLNDIKVYQLCLIFYFVRFFLDSLCTSWEMVVLVQVLQSLTFTLYAISGLHFLNRILPPGVKTSGITLYAASGGLGSFFGNIGGGVFLQKGSIFMLYRIIAFIAIAALCIALLTEKKAKRQA